MNDLATPALDKPTLLLFTAWAKANHINLTPRPATATRPSQITAEQIYTDERHVPDGQLLTLREYQVLAGMALGMTNEEIGADLYLSVDTVKTHARRLFRKLDVKNRTQAAMAAPAALRHLVGGAA